MLIIDAQEFRILTTTRRIETTDGKIRVVGTAQAVENLIILDDNLPDSRKAEVLLHEMIHLAEPQIREEAVESISTKLYGYLATNSMLASNFLSRALDGEASAEQVGDVIASLEAQAVPVAAKSGRARFKSEVSDPDVESPVDSESPNGVAGGDEDEEGSDDETVLERSLGRARGERNEARAEADRLRESNTTLLKEKKEREDAEKTELELAQSEAIEAKEALSAAEAKASFAAKRGDVLAKAASAGAQNAEVVFKMLEADPSIEVNDDLSVSGVDDAIEALKASDPYLFGKPQGKPGADGGATGDPEEDLSGGSGARALLSPDKSIRDQQVEISQHLGRNLSKP